MVSNFNWSHNLSFKLFLGVLRTHPFFYFLDCNLPSSPFTFKNLWRVPKSNFLFKFECWILNYILLSTFLNFLDYETFKINETTIGSEIVLRNVHLFYLRDHLFFFLKQCFLLIFIWTICSFAIFLDFALLFVLEKVYELNFFNVILLFLERNTFLRTLKKNLIILSFGHINFLVTFIFLFYNTHKISKLIFFRFSC